MKIHEQMNVVMDTVVKQQREMVRDGLRKRMSEITDEELSRLHQFTGAIMKDMPIDGMLDDMVPVYQKHLSKSDVDAVGTFHSSATGRNLLGEMPARTAEAMPAAQPHMQAMLDKMMDRMEKRAKEEREKRNKPPAPCALKT